jgi:transposase
VICVETRHMQAVLKAQIKKTDRNDARGIAQMIRVGVHVKTLRSQKLRMLLTHRKRFCSRRPSPSRTICEVLCATSASRSEWLAR